MIDILGGTASTQNSINYYSKHYIAIASLDDSTKDITVTYKDHGLSNRNLQKIPFIRVLVSTFHQKFISPTESFQLDGFAILYVLIYLIDKVFLKLNMLEYLYGIYFFVVFIVSKYSDLAKLHGAEHATYNYYNKKGNLDNIESIRNEKLTVDRCGTTSIILNLILFYTIKIDDYILRYLICVVLTGEIVRLIDNSKIFNRIGTPIILLSRLFQKIIFTKKPDVIHVSMAIEAIKKLEELEEKRNN